MSKKNSLRRPYEIVETLEETITRYFNEDLSESNSFDWKFGESDYSQTPVNLKKQNKTERSS